MKRIHLDQIKATAIPILKGAGVTKSSLFGSYVRGEETEQSDIDILVDFPKTKSLFDFIGLKLELEESLQRKVDLVEYDTIKPHLKQYILSEQIQIL